MHRALQAGIVLLVLVLVALAASASERPREDGSADGCFMVWVSAEGGSADRAGWHRSFSASDILDLSFHVLLPANRGIENVELKLFTPKGHLYQSIRMPVASEEEAPRPRGHERFRWVSTRLPVAGTTIVTSSLYGRWKAEAYVDGSSSPCGRARAFTLEP